MGFLQCFSERVDRKYSRGEGRTFFDLFREPNGLAFATQVVVDPDG